MATEFALSIVAPDREVMAKPMRSIILPGEVGYLGIMAGHEPMVVSLKEGIIETEEPTGRRTSVQIGGGFAEITPSRVTILADSAVVQGA